MKKHAFLTVVGCLCLAQFAAADADSVAMVDAFNTRIADITKKVSKYCGTDLKSTIDPAGYDKTKFTVNPYTPAYNALVGLESVCLKKPEYKAAVAKTIKEVKFGFDPANGPDTGVALEGSALVVKMSSAAKGVDDKVAKFVTAQISK